MWVTVLIQEQFKTIALVNLVYRPTKKKEKQFTMSSEIADVYFPVFSNMTL